MEDYSIFNDFTSYIKENEPLIEYLTTSLLSDLVLPIIKTLTYLETINNEEELSPENHEIFVFGFEYLFENLEQIKLYLREFNNDFIEFETKAILIRTLFQLEEFKVELTKNDEFDSDIKHDLKKIATAIDFFEDCITTKIIDEHELEKHIRFLYELVDKYDNIMLMSDAFNEYCASYGI